MRAFKAAPDVFGQKEEKALDIKGPEVEFDEHAAARLAGVEDLSEEEQEKIEQSAAQRGKRTRLLCFCGSRGCGIGPFTKAEEY